MIAIVELVVFIYLGLLQPKRSCVLGTFGLRFSKIVWSRSKSAIRVKSILEKCVLIQLHFFQSLLSVPLQSGVLIIILVTRLRLCYTKKCHPDIILTV